MRGIIIWGLALALANPLCAQELSSAGSLKGYLVRSQEPSVLGVKPPVAQNETLIARYRLSGALNKAWFFDGAYQLTSLHQDPAPIEAIEIPGAYRWGEPEHQLYPNEGEKSSTQIFQNLDRFSLQYRAEGFDITLGRQAITFGMGRSVSPNDLFANFTLSELDLENRLGVDAVRLEVPLGELSELDLGALFGKNGAAAQGGGYLRVKVNLAGQDLVLLAAQYKRHQAFGGELALALGKIGAWVEGTWTKPFEATSPEYGRYLAGADYTFGEDTYLWLEYHLNGAGAKEASNYHQPQANQSYLDAGGYLWGREYLNLGGNFPLTPLNQLSLFFMSNRKDQSTYVNTTLESNLTTDLYLDLGITHLTGNPDQTEFGTYPAQLYLAIRGYL
ncbi:MAG: hypothetical protein A2508_06650 [Candidatus Lambdaproteobacteria bacterium RIFOXYD12_FULL_49_8]|nr:MAG: hypothetical protein A2508_06650 [Candidatus Lambdaproteobacteria bacterium RIFOXYD12_FULL_49_8]